MMARLRNLISLLACLMIVDSVLYATQGAADQIQLSTILPKLQAIHEDSRNLLIKNGELKAKILVGLQAQNEAKLKLVKESQLLPPQQQTQQHQAQQSPPSSKTESIDYAELEEFNKWVDTNLDYAVKNTHATIEALKEEAQASNGMIDYTEEAIKDGIEGVKYWQSAVIFQDKTLKNEEFVVPE